MSHLITFEDLQVVNATREKGDKWGAPIGKAREEAEARSQRVFWDNSWVP